MCNIYYNPFLIKVMCFDFIIYLAFSAMANPNYELIWTLEGLSIWVSTSDAT